MEEADNWNLPPLSNVTRQHFRSLIKRSGTQQLHTRTSTRTRTGTRLRDQDQEQDRGQNQNRDMDLKKLEAALLLVCCSALWAAAAAPPSGCHSLLSFSTHNSSWSEGHGNNLHAQSLSPWQWRISTNPNQIPSTIWEAECSSHSCSALWSGQSDTHRLNSVPIRQAVLVLTRNDGSRCYTATYRSVAVGCTCVRAVTNQS